MKKNLNMMNDVLFKFVFGSKERKHITIDFINSMLEREGENAVKDIAFKNSEITPLTADVKLSRLDVYYTLFKKTPDQKLTKMDHWLAYFAGKLSEQEAEVMDDAALKDAWNATNLFMLDDEEWRNYVNREIAIMDYNTDMRASREEGREEEKKDMILEMLRSNQPISLIAQFSKYPVEKIAKIGEENGIEIK